LEVLNRAMGGGLPTWPKSRTLKKGKRSEIPLAVVFKKHLLTNDRRCGGGIYRGLPCKRDEVLKGLRTSSSIGSNFTTSGGSG